MMTFFSSRLKAFLGFAAVGVTTAILKAVEMSVGFDIPLEYETAIISVVTGWTVNYTTNVS